MTEKKSLKIIIKVFVGRVFAQTFLVLSLLPPSFQWLHGRVYSPVLAQEKGLPTVPCL